MTTSRKAALATIMAAMLATTCLDLGDFDGGLARVVLGAGNDAGHDAGVSSGDGGFVVRVWLPLSADAGVFWTAQPTALGRNGEIAGFGYAPSNTPQLGFHMSSRGELEWWKATTKRPVFIHWLDGDGGYCGEGLWPDPEFGPNTEGGTAVVGTTADNAVRLLPDPVYSSCSDGNAEGIFIGEWKAQGYVREVDGGVIRLDWFMLPQPLSRYDHVEPRAVNASGLVVGRISYGDFLGHGNPVGFLRSRDGGVTLLDNGPRPCSARDINDHGVIVGRGHDIVNFIPMPMVWFEPYDAGMVLPLPEGMMEGEAEGINNEGLIVGMAFDFEFGQHGVLWWQGRAYLADELIAGQTKLTVSRLSFVNDNRRVLGNVREPIYGSDGGVEAIASWPIVIDILQMPQ